MTRKFGSFVGVVPPVVVGRSRIPFRRTTSPRTSENAGCALSLQTKLHLLCTLTTGFNYFIYLFKCNLLQRANF